MKVFISGPMSGKPNYNRAAFFKAEEELEKHGYSVWNPAWLAYPSNTEFSKDAIHAIDNEALRHCDAIYMLKGWMHSEGAWNEHEIAEARELVIMYEGKCCWDNEPEDEHDVLKRHIKTVEEALAWERWKNDLPANGGLGLSFNLMNERVSSNKRDISSLRNDIDDIHNWINAHDRMLKAQSSQMSDLGSKLDENNDDYKEAYKHLDNADEALERRIKALEKKSDELNHAVGVQGKEIGGIIQRRCDDNQVVNNMLNDINIRLKGIEKRLNIKPFYAPTEDEKDDN